MNQCKFIRINIFLKKIIKVQLIWFENKIKWYCYDNNKSIYNCAFFINQANEKRNYVHKS